MDNYNLFEVAVMGTADYLRDTRYSVPKWMNKTEAKAYKIGFERAREQCKSPHMRKRK
jgi:hypothetical protein